MERRAQRRKSFFKQDMGKGLDATGFLVYICYVAGSEGYDRRYYTYLDRVILEAKEKMGFDVIRLAPENSNSKKAWFIPFEWRYPDGTEAIKDRWEAKYIADKIATIAAEFGKPFYVFEASVSSPSQVRL